MIDINIPGFGEVYLEHLVLDYNGTLAFDGRLIKEVAYLLEQFVDRLHVHILTADTFGSVKKMFADSPCTVHVISSGQEDVKKADYVEQLGCAATACIGNGRNDRLMLKKAALGIAVMQQEGASPEALLAADVVTSNILDALGLLLHPKRVAATLRC